MTKLTRHFPQHGASGTAPPSSKDWVADEQVEEDIFDYLWDKVYKNQENTYDHLEYDGFSPFASGVVDDGDAKLLYLTEVSDNDELYVTQASLTKTDGGAVPSGMDMVIVAEGSVQTTLLTGNGTTVFQDSTSDPLGKYENTSGSTQQALIAVDNGHYAGASGGSGSSVEHQASVKGRVQ